MYIRTGDEVQVMAGKDRGLTGKVIAVMSDSDRVLVEGVNRVVKHTRVGESNKGAKTGGIEHMEAPVHVSNVMLIDPEDNKPTRVGFKRVDVEKHRADGSSYQGERSVRYSKRSGKEF
jgi:large subunit ribosomal protein L24